MSHLLHNRWPARAGALLFAAVLLPAAGCPNYQPAKGPGPVIVETTPGGTSNTPVNPPDNPAPDPKGTGAPTPPPLPLSTGRRLALLVGVKDYDSPDFRNLNFTEADVEDLAQTLRGDGYDPADIVVMTRKHAAQDPALMPTVENIRAQLDALLKRCGKDDVVLVGLTGHGIQPKDGKQFFCGYKAVLADLKEVDPKTLLPIEEVYQRLGACPASLKILLVDACRDDPESKGPRRTSEDYKTVTSGPTQAGVIALYSCSEGESSWEPTSLQHGVFFHFLIEGLQGKADMHQDGRITWTELIDYLDRSVDPYTMSQLHQRQRPHFKGESNVEEPVAIRPAAGGASRPTDVTLQPIDGLLDEDFRTQSLGKPPAGWDGDELVVVQDKSRRKCLEVNLPRGEHSIALPRMSLKGDFYLETEVLLDGWGNVDNETNHRLTIELEGASGGGRVPVVVDYKGGVSIQNGQTREAQNFTPYKPTRVRLVRSGKNLSVFLNGEIATGKDLDSAGEFDTIRLGLTAGVPASNNLGVTAKIYSVKLGGVKGDAGAPPPSERLLLAEDFKQVKPGGVPAGWDGDAFSAVKDKNGRACLEVNRKAGVYWIYLPRMPLKGDFYVEAEVLLDGWRSWPPPDRHKLFVDLEARGGAVRVPIMAAFEGTVIIGTGSEGRKADDFKGFKPIRVRIAREGKVCNVTLNDEVVTGMPLDYTGDFDTVRLGLVAGVPFDNTLNTTAKIYSVRVGLAGEGSVPPPPPDLPPGVREDFSKATAGGLPNGWTGTPLHNLTVQQTGEHKDLELTNAANGGDLVILPKADLKGNFYIEFEAQFPTRDGAVTLQLGGTKARPLALQLDGRGQLSSPGTPTADLSKTFLGDGQTNVLGLERTDRGYIIKLNETQVGALPAGPGAYDTVGLVVGVKDKDQKSPHVNTVRVQPLP